MSQREEKVLGTEWKTERRRRTWGDCLASATADPRARNPPTEGTSAPHTTFQAQFQWKWDSWLFRLLNVHRSWWRHRHWLDPSCGTLLSTSTSEWGNSRQVHPVLDSILAPSSQALQCLLLSLAFLLTLFNTQRTSLGCLDNWNQEAQRLKQNQLTDVPFDVSNKSILIRLSFTLFTHLSHSSPA